MNLLGGFCSADEEKIYYIFLCDCEQRRLFCVFLLAHANTKALLCYSFFFNSVLLFLAHEWCVC